MFAFSISRKRRIAFGVSRSLLNADSISVSIAKLDDSPQEDILLRQRFSVSCAALIEFQVLGLDLNRPAVARELTEEMQSLLNERTKARSEKRWADSDALRVQLENLGLEIKDTPEGQNWS